MNNREICCLIVDQNNQIGNVIKYFKFSNVIQLDLDIDDYILNFLNLKRVDVTLDDYNLELSEEEEEFLLEKGYYLDFITI